MKKRFKNYFIALLALFATYFGYANNDEQVIVFVDPTQLVFIESKVDTTLDFSKNIYTEESEVFIKENTVLVEKEDSFENAILFMKIVSRQIRNIFISQNYL